MVGIARFAKKTSTNHTNQGNAPQEHSHQGPNDATTSIQRSGSEEGPPMGDAMEIEAFGCGGNNDFQDIVSDFGDDIGIVNGGGTNYSVDFDLSDCGKFDHRQEGASVGGKDAFCGNDFGMDNVDDFDLSYQVNMAGDDDANNMYRNNGKGSKASGGFSRFTMMQEEDDSFKGKGDNNGGFSKTLQEDTFTSKNDTVNNKGRKTMSSNAGLGYLSQEQPSTHQHPSGLANSTETATNKNSIVIQKDSSGTMEGQIFLQDKPNVNSSDGSHHTGGRALGLKSSLGREGDSVTAQSTSGHFNKIIPLPRRTIPGIEETSGLRRPPEQGQFQSAIPKPSKEAPIQNLIDRRQINEDSRISAAASSGMQRFSNASMSKVTLEHKHLQQVSKPSKVPPTLPSTGPNVKTVSPCHMAPKEYVGPPHATSSDTNTKTMGGQRELLELRGHAAASIQRSIDMEHDTFEHAEEPKNPEARRVSIENPSKENQMHHVKAMMQDANNQRLNSSAAASKQQQHPSHARYQAERRNSTVTPDARRVSIETPVDEQYQCDTPMEHLYHEGQTLQQALDDDKGLYNQNEETNQEWPNNEHPMDEEGNGEAMYAPSLFTFDGQSQAFTDAHELTEDLQSEICADLRKMTVKFFMEYPELLQRCDELLELWGKCEDLESQVDGAMSRFDAVMSTILQGEEEVAPPKEAMETE
ncbi:hypothetical protein IV203_005430 [Nitzschia inconspicua]|uniref:Uncharacterized protein n=1 Tax=Nitzschia inconspicua TaxID=303405 RepID=A0A9K3PG27_9STRA|nr:hypothetical protein IV203_005430 [Nitzschia inconspicua]